MRTYYIPALIMLSAGTVDCLLAIRNHLSLKEMLIELLIVLIVFYVIGTLIRIIFDRNFPIMTDSEEADGEETTENGDELTVEEIEESEGTEQAAQAGQETQEAEDNAASVQ